MGELIIEDVAKRFGELQALHGIRLQVEAGEFCVFVGPSGCGKSTLLRIIAGLEQASEGRVSLGGRSIDHLPPAERGIAMVFQTYALYPHLTASGNMQLGLKQAKLGKQERGERVRRAAEMLELGELLERRPAEMSGGQRQRVAIGRALVRKPDLFLFDEPLSNLDAALRVNTRLEIAALHRELGTTMIYVTHDQVEAMTLADRIVILNQGRIEQVGAPMTLYERPANTFVATFLGSPKMNLMEGARLPELAQGAATIGARPEHIAVARTGDGLAVRVRHLERLGVDSNLYLQAEGLEEEVVARVFGSHDFAIGDELRMQLDPAQVLRFDGEGRAVAGSA